MVLVTLADGYRVALGLAEADPIEGDLRPAPARPDRDRYQRYRPARALPLTRVAGASGLTVEGHAD